MRRTLYLAATLLFLGGSAAAQNSGGKTPRRAAEISPGIEQMEQKVDGRTPVHQNGASRAACNGDTIFYEDFANGFTGNNTHGIAWDTSGTFQAWRECPSLCGTNGSSFNLAPFVSAPTQGNGIIHMDIQAEAGYIYGNGFGPAGEPEGPPPLQEMTMDSIIDLSSLNAPVITLHTAFVHCCALDHEILLEVDTNNNGNWATAFDLSANASRNQIEEGKFVYHLGPAIQGNADSVRIRFTWPATGPDANGQVSGVYSWYIDDVVIRDANRNDVSIGNSAYKVEDEVFKSGFGFGCPLEYSQIPRCDLNLSAFEFGGQVCNIGQNNLNSVQLQATVIDSSGPNMGNQVYQETSASMSLDSISCIGGNVAGYRPPDPDTVWAAPTLSNLDTGDYEVFYRAVTADSADCVPANNVGTPKEFKVTAMEYALDRYESGTPSENVSPSSGSNYTEITAYNAFEFNWFDPVKDTVNFIKFWLSDTTQAGARIVAGISANVAQDKVYGLTNPFFPEASDIGGWVKLPITRDGAGNPLPNGLPVADLQNDPDSIKTAFVSYGGGGQRVGFGISGAVECNGAWIQGDFGGSGADLYRTGTFHMLRVIMNHKDNNCNVASVGEQLDERGFFLGQNRPNPATGETRIAYELEQPHRIEFTVRDVTGKVVHRENYGRKQQGRHRIELNSSKFDAGVYYYTLQVDDKRATRKMMITR